MIKQYDVVVMGAGIAGTVLTHLLLTNNINTLLIGKADKPSVKLGESLPPSAGEMLKRLGLSDFISSHQTSSGYQKIWGNKQISKAGYEGSSDDDMATNPCGWKVDKTRLIKQIQASLPVTAIRSANVIDVDVSEQFGIEHVIHLANGSGEYSGDNSGQYLGNNSGKNSANNLSDHFAKNSDFCSVDEAAPIRGKILVDATGRKGLLSRQLGIHSHQFDQLLAYTVNVPKIIHPKITKPVFIEAFEHGWGLVSRLDKHQNVISLFTNKYSGITAQCKQFKNWQRLCTNTRYFKHLLPVDTNTEVTCLNASSRIAGQLGASNWLLVGDAAMTFDPLSSHGMTTAIYSAEQAAKSICQRLRLPATPHGHHPQHHANSHMESYGRNMTAIYNTYLNELIGLYAQQTQWPNSGFWQSKQKLRLGEQPAMVV